METITEKDLLKTDPELKNRQYQIEALLSIFLYIKCLVKMFCGTGKSRIITNVIIHEKKNLSVVVFPSLALISQYSADYLNNAEYARHFKKHKTMNVSTLKEKVDGMESDTDAKEIKKFLKLKSPKIILVTYQSYHVLLQCLEGQKIGLVCYDEAHHVTSPETQKLVFGTAYFEKEVFFTATPKNENGITMFHRECPEKNMCGPVAYDYTYLQGLTDEVLNAFEICIDMYTENTNTSIYEALARAILSKGTSRVLSFHSGVNGESNTNVKNFAKEEEFKIVFQQILMAEFRDKQLDYTKITFNWMDGKTLPSVRKAMLKALDDTPNNEIYIIASCETIGEGVDTKKANMCLFTDPKSSVTKIIQNIGRVVRRNKAHPLSTILIPCWVNMENYAAAKGDRAKQDELIRQQMRSEKGDYASILNVLGALRQEDPELYEQCLNYSDSREDESDEDSDELSEADTESVSEAEADTEDRRPNKRIRMSIHQNDAVQMFWGVTDELDFSKKFCSVVIDCEVVKVDPMEVAAKIVEFVKNERRMPRKLENPNLTLKEKQEQSFYRKLRYWGDVLRGKTRVHGGLCSNEVRDYLDTEIPDWRNELNLEENALNIAREIIAFVKKEVRFPKNLGKKRSDMTPIEKQEASYAGKLSQWKLAIKGKTGVKGKTRVCFPSVRNLLDTEIPGWRDEVIFEDESLNTAHKIVAFYKEKGRIPNLFTKAKKDTLSLEQQNEQKYTRKLDYWKMAIKGNIKKPMYPSVLAYLDQELPGWRAEQDLKQNAINSAKNIVAFYKKEGRMPKSYQTKNTSDLTPSEKIEKTYSHKIIGWKAALKCKGSQTCYDEVRELLDEGIPGWSKEQELEKKAMDNAKEIVAFYNKEKRLPFLYRKKNDLNTEEKIEKKYAQKLTNWKNALNGKGHQLCYDEVRDYLDKELPGWRPIEPEPTSVPIAPTVILKKKRTKKKLIIIPDTSEQSAETKSTTPHHFPPPSEIGLLHKTYLKMRSDTLHAKFKAEPQLWRDYHATRKRNFAPYPQESIPSNQIIQELEKIQTKRQKVVVDMGCGEAPIAHHFLAKNDLRFTFHNYDHQSGGDPLIQEVDISALPLDDASVEICIMSLALWGTHENCTQYIKEAYRILESGGKFYISDSTKKWSPEPLTQENGGDVLRTLLIENGFKIINEEIGMPFCLFVCTKIY